MRKIISNIILFALVFVTISGCSATNTTTEKSEVSHPDVFYSWTSESADAIYLSEKKTTDENEEWLGRVYYFDRTNYGEGSFYANYQTMYFIRTYDDVYYYDNKSYNVGEYSETTGSKVDACTEMNGVLVRDAIQGDGADGLHYHDGELFTGYCDNCMKAYDNGVEVENNTYYCNIYNSELIYDATTYYMLSENEKEEYKPYEGTLYLHSYNDDSDPENPIHLSAYSTKDYVTFTVYGIKVDGGQGYICVEENYNVGDEVWEGAVVNSVIGKMTEIVQIQ